MWQIANTTLFELEQSAAGTPLGVAVEPAPAHSTVPAAQRSQLAVAEIATAEPAVSVTPVFSHSFVLTLTVKLVVDAGRHPDAPQHFCPDVQQL
jgi:kynurenine formamidase